MPLSTRPDSRNTVVFHPLATRERPDAVAADDEVEALIAKSRVDAEAQKQSILAEANRSPWRSAEELRQRLRAQCPSLTPEGVLNLFAFHGLTLKKTPPFAT